MRFLELHLDGFGKLIGQTFTFAPGLNLVFGHNEAGKSTLQQALLAMLYGFHEDGSVSKAKQEGVAASAPWLAGAEFGGSLLYSLDDGQSFLATRLFSGKMTTHLRIAPDGRDVSGDHRSATHGRLFFADKQLGMAKPVFENTCVVRQAELLALGDSARAITDTLMRLSASASPGTTSANALDLLDKALKEEVGTDRMSTKPLAQARKRLEELRAVQQATDKTRREALALISEINQEETQLDGLSQEIERLGYLATLAEQQANQGQLDASVQADEEAEQLLAEVERWKSWASFPAHLRDGIIALSAECTRLAKEVNEHVSQTASVQRQRAEIAGQVGIVDKQVASLADAQNTPVDRLPQLQRLAAQWELAGKAAGAASQRHRRDLEHLGELDIELAARRKKLGIVADLGREGLEQLQRSWVYGRQWLEQSKAAAQEAQAAWDRVGMSEEQYQAVVEIVKQIEAGTYVQEHPKKGCSFLSRSQAPQAPPPELAIYGQIKPIRDRWEETRLYASTAEDSLAAAVERARQAFRLSADEWLSQAHFDAANKQLAEYLHLLGEAGTQQQAVAVAQSNAENARQEAAAAKEALAAAVRDLGQPVADLGAAVTQFEHQCQRKTQFDRATAELQRLRGEDRLLAQEEQAQTRREEALHQARQSLHDALAQANIVVEGDDLAGGAARFEEGYRLHLRSVRAQDSYEAALERPASGLTKSAREEARRRVETLQRQLDSWRVAHPEWGVLKADHGAHEYRERSQRLEAERTLGQQRRTQLKGSLQRMTAGLSHPADIAEEIAATQAKLGRLEHLRDVLTLARDELAAATQEYQRAFAPRLEKLVADRLARATQGRYGQVRIDPSTLAVSLVAPERDKPVEAAVLSTGTRDLVYLLLRIAIAQLMSGSGETLPLLLDDPLVQLDRNRQEHTLNLLVRLADETQIILFTKDEGILAWFERGLTGEQRHRLHSLS